MGCALGFVCSLLIFLWVKSERDMDKFNTGGDRIYSVYERQYEGGKTEAKFSTQGLMAEEMKRVMPEVENATSLGRNMMHTFQVGDKILKEDGNWAGADFFSVFSYPVV